MSITNENLFGELIGGYYYPEELKAYILNFFDTADLSTAATVNKGINSGITEIWRRIASKFKYPVDGNQSPLRNYKNFINDLLRAIKACLKEDVPSDILAIAEIAEEKVPTVVQACKLQEFIKAKDTLVVWKLLAKQANIEVDVSKAWKTVETSIGLADLFAKWVSENQEKLKGLDQLDLSKQNLDSIPKELGNTTSLKKLYLDGNRLVSIPSDLGKLTNLEALYLSNNQLKAIPKELGNLQYLQALLLCNNLLTVIPEELGNLKNLFCLYLSGNQLKAIPKELGEAKELSNLQLGNNQLTSIPKELANLKWLMKLVLTGNLLALIPEELQAKPLLQIKN